MPIKTFRGKLADGAIDTIALHTRDGSIGYRIVKLEAFAADEVGTVESANLLSVWKTPQTTAPGSVDFSNQELLGAIDFRQHDNEAYGNSSYVVVFDSEIFNQDIHVCNVAQGGQTGALNYYMELEQIKLGLNENTVATLKDIRND
jgi:hypothetical protein